MMMGMHFNLTSKGLTAKVEGISISNSFLDKTKIVKRFSLMEGTPQKLLGRIAEQIYLATGGRVQIVKGVLTGGSSTKPAEPFVPEGSDKIGINVDYGDPSDLPIQWAVEPKDGDDVLALHLMSGG